MKDCCRNCYYYYWRGLVEHCYHPDIDKDLKNSKAKCPKYQRADKKFMPDEEGKRDYGYPDRLPFHAPHGLSR